MTGTTDRPPRTRAAAVAATGFIGVAGFEAALALGAPLGRAAFGGGAANLSTGFRITAAFAVGLWVLAALVILSRAGYTWSPIPFHVSRYGTWVLIVLQTLGTLMNLASRSNWERFIWAPISLVMAVLCFVVARGGTPHTRERTEAADHPSAEDPLPPPL
jgi:hypothetical protein